MSTWFLEINGVKRGLSAWGITSAKFQRGNQIADTLSVTARADFKLAFETPCVLWLDSERQFSGIVTDLPFDGQARGDRRQYVISGPWWYLEKIIYQQASWVPIDGSDISKGYTSAVTSATMLFVSSSGGKIPIADQARKAINYAIIHGAPIGGSVLTNFEFDVPWEEGNDLSCAEVIRRCLRWNRDSVAWWDYSSALPVLNIGRRNALGTTTLDLDSGNAVIELNPKPRYDLLPRGVQVNWLREKYNANGDAWMEVTPQSAGASDVGVRVIVITYKLAGSGSTAEPIPGSLVSEFWASLALLQWAGSVVVNYVGASGSFGPGLALNLLHGDEEWASMTALIQMVEEDLFTGETRIEYGPANQLGFQDFLALQSMKRDSKKSPDLPPPPDKPIIPPPPPPPPGWPPPPPSDPSGTDTGTGNKPGEVTIEVCNDGSPMKLTVMGYVTK